MQRHGGDFSGGAGNVPMNSRANEQRHVSFGNDGENCDTDSVGLQFRANTLVRICQGAHHDKNHAP